MYPYLREVWHTMRACVERGLNRTGTLSGGLNLARKASLLRSENTKFEPSLMHENRKVSAYALAAAEENADNGVIVTAPTCGAAGIVPAVLYYMYENCGVGESELLDALAVAGVIGNVVKQNASISGAECGCQGGGRRGVRHGGGWSGAIYDRTRRALNARRKSHWSIISG